MSGLQAPRRPGGAPTIVHLVGDLDVVGLEALRTRLGAALELGEPIVVDLGDCTFAGVEILALLIDASDRARQESRGFVVVLPYSANALVRRLLLEIAPELATFPIVPSVRSASALLTQSPVLAPRPRAEDLRRRILRANVWETAAQVNDLLARSDKLVLEARETLERVRARRRG